MKVTDLMVGDWVYDTMRQENKKVTRMDFERNPINGVYYAETLLPIFITEEILEKNSIKIHSFTGTLYWFDEDEHCCVKPIEDRFMFMYSKGADYLTFRIAYVHQLQHLLRLCGIEKELVID